MDDFHIKLAEAAEFIKSKIGVKPQIAIILGSGLGTLADEIRSAVYIHYNDIPNFPATTVKGHEGALISGMLRGRPVLAMKGRIHYYEGHEMLQVVFPVMTLKSSGVENLLITNAAGGINKKFRPGDFMIIKDHIGFLAPSALRESGRESEDGNDLFTDMTGAYNKDLVKMAAKAASKAGIKLRTGVYAFTQGPMYETPAEVRALGAMGADAVGMSTAPEVIAARHAGMKVLGISCITNMAAGIMRHTLSHDDVMETARKVENKFSLLIGNIIEGWSI